MEVVQTIDVMRRGERIKGNGISNLATVIDQPLDLFQQASTAA